MSRFICSSAFLISLALSAVGCGEHPAAEPKQVAFSMSDTMLKKITLHRADSSEVKNEMRFFGKIAADNNKLAQVYPIVSGVVKSIAVELGDYVRQGQVLASIESGEVAEFQKEMLNALSEVAIAEKNLAVARDLFAGKLTSEKDVAVAEKELEKAKAELARITEVYKIYSLKNGSVYNITAPISGFIVSKKINQNEQIRADISEPLFSIAEIDEVWALANITESDIAKVKVGYEADVRTLAFPDSVYRGKIDKIFNAIDPETKSMKVRVRIPNKNLMLKPEMNCTVSVRFSEKKKMISVPSAAVIFDKNKYWVMVFKDRYNIETRQVELYRQLPDITYLSFGLSAGENVIVKNALLVYDALND